MAVDTGLRAMRNPRQRAATLDARGRGGGIREELAERESTHDWRFLNVFWYLALTARRTRKFTRKKPPDFSDRERIAQTSTPRQVEMSAIGSLIASLGQSDSSKAVIRQRFPSATAKGTEMS